MTTENSSELRKKKNIIICPILGVNINVTNLQCTISFVQDNLETLYGSYICVSNVHTTIMCQDDEEYCNIQNKAVLALPDGGPLSFVQRHRGFSTAERVTGPDLMEALFKISVKNGYRHYFYGSTEDVLYKLEKKLCSLYPGIQIGGKLSPPFRTLSEEEDKAIVREINNANVDFIWVGLGAPKQERWMADHHMMVHGLMIGVGAGFDYHAGTLKRAPKWMQRTNLEWVYRLKQEPKRLFKRYLITNARFVRLVLKENCSIHGTR